MNIKQKFTKDTLSMKASLIRELVAKTKGIPGLISLAGGFPSPDTFPIDDISSLFDKTILEDGRDIFQYGASNGDTKLIDQIKKFEGIEDYNDEEILITSGSTNGIYLFSKCLVAPGESIICESPSFLGSLVTFEAADSNLIGIELDEEGIRADLLEEKIIRVQKKGIDIKFMYLIPEFQNPTGITMSLQRRYAIIELAIKYDIPILEDNPYGALRYTGEAIPDMYKIARNEFNNNQIVTCVKSFSKILGPGLRLAYLIGHKDVIDYMGKWQQKITISADCVTQRVVANFIKDGLMDKQIEKLVEFYSPLRETMLSAMERYMPKEIVWTKPEGGMFVWIDLPENIDGDKIFELATKEKVAFIPGSKFYPTGTEKQNTMRLNFSYPTKKQIEIGVERIGNLLKKVIENS
ncbi:MAG: PLP-dependent aminotransferase family protein [Candidatus Cloacimonadota bacterium]|nr:PLP-dependent aminotransferase family protein [Candidatus Cloacimonadota bacterium]